MKQLLLLPVWADDANQFFTENSFSEVCDRYPEVPWQAFWIELEQPRAALSWVRNSSDTKARPMPCGAWLKVRAVERFVCIRCLPSGPMYKLSEWDQLDVGRAILWQPEPDDQAVSRAEGSAAYLRAQGRGRFDVQHRDDGTLWIARQA